jgi:hypothetical protein
MTCTLLLPEYYLLETMKKMPIINTNPIISVL